MNNIVPINNQRFFGGFGILPFALGLATAPLLFRPGCCGGGYPPPPPYPYPPYPYPGGGYSYSYQYDGYYPGFRNRPLASCFNTPCYNAQYAVNSPYYYYNRPWNF